MVQTPAAAPLVAAALRCEAPAFDISAACAGYCYSVQLAADMIAAGTADHVLVVGADALSLITDPSDRGIAFLLADGAGAAIVSYSSRPGIWPAAWGSNGDKHQMIVQRQPWSNRTPTGLQMGTLEMSGPEVFRWATTEVAEVASQALEIAGCSARDLSAFVPHQANLRIIQALSSRLNLPSHVLVADDIRVTGNTSAASIPLATEALLAKNPEIRGGLCLQVGFGAGLTYAAQVVRMPE